MERAQEPDSHFEPVTFDLAKGAKVRVEMAEFWEQLSESDRRLGNQPTLYFAIRTYSDEDTYPRRLVQHTEFRAGSDFDQCANRRLWTWLEDLAGSRHRFIYDTVEDFLDEFAARMDEFGAIGEDAADYIHKTRGTRHPLPYEDPPHEGFIEDERARSTPRSAEPEEPESDGVEEEIETVLGEEETRGDNFGLGDLEAEEPTDEPDETSNP